MMNFWKKKTSSPEKSGGQEEKIEKKATPKPCCGGAKTNNKKDETHRHGTEGRSTTSTESEGALPESSNVPGIEFGSGAVSSGVKLYGQCSGSDPNVIEACVWRPVNDAASHRIIF